MPLNTTLPASELSTSGRWETAPSIDKLRSRYDASATHWQENLVRIGQFNDYQLLFQDRAVSGYLHSLNQPSKILDCGVGTGAFSLALLDNIKQPAHFSGVDISYPMLSQAQQNLKDRCATLDLRQGNIRHLPFADESFDAIIFAHVLEHMVEPVETLREMVRVLKPGAPLIGSVTRKGLGQAFMSLRWHHRGYTTSQMNLFLQAAGLEDTKTFDYGNSWSKRMCIAITGVRAKKKNREHGCRTSPSGNQALFSATGG